MNVWLFLWHTYGLRYKYPLCNMGLVKGYPHSYFAVAPRNFSLKVVRDDGAACLENGCLKGKR